MKIKQLERKVFRVKQKVKINQFSVLNTSDVYYSAFVRGNSLDVKPLGVLKGSKYSMDSLIRKQRRDITISNEVFTENLNSFEILGSPKEIKTQLENTITAFSEENPELSDIIDFIDEYLMGYPEFNFWNRDSLINEFAGRLLDK